MKNEDIKNIICQTLNEADKRKVGIKFTLPETFHGWVALIIALVALTTIFWKSFAFIHVATKHHSSPHPFADEKLISRIDTLVTKHIEQGDHYHNSELEMKIMKQTQPMREDIEVIQKDIGAIRARVEVLLERKFLNQKHGGNAK